MSKHVVKPVDDEIRDCIDALLDLEEGLTDWETKFIDDLRTWPAISKKQRARVIAIYDRLIGNK